MVVLWCSHSKAGRTRLRWHWSLGMGTRSGPASREITGWCGGGGWGAASTPCCQPREILFATSKQSRRSVYMQHAFFKKWAFCCFWRSYASLLSLTSSAISFLPSSLFSPPSLHPPCILSPLSLSPLSMCSDYLSKLAISWLLYRDDVSLCPRVHQVGFLSLYLVKPKLTAGLVGVLLDLTKGLGLVLMRVNLVWFIAGLSKKINGSPFESKSLIALCTYVSSLWIFFPPFHLLLSPFSISHSLILILSLHHCLVCFYFFLLLHPTPPNPGYWSVSVDGIMVKCQIDFFFFSVLISYLSG